MLVLVVEQIGSDLPLAIHEVEILFVAGGLGHVGEDGRRHEERVAPPPERLGRIVGRGEFLVEAGLHAGHHLGVFVEEVLLHVHLANGLIVCVFDARAGLPLKLVGDVLHGLLVLVAGDGVGNAHEAGVERGPGPVILRLRRAWRVSCQSATIFMALASSGLVEFWREVLCERAGSCAERISGRRDRSFFLRMRGLNGKAARAKRTGRQRPELGGKRSFPAFEKGLLIFI